MNYPDWGKGLTRRNTMLRYNRGLWPNRHSNFVQYRGQP